MLLTQLLDGALLVGDADVYDYFLDYIEDRIPDLLSMVKTPGITQSPRLCQYKFSKDRLRAVTQGYKSAFSQRGPNITHAGTVGFNLHGVDVDVEGRNESGGEVVSQRC